MASSNVCNNLTTKNFLRHVESLNNIPSGAGKISQLNAVILGDALASEENDLVCPSKDFSNQALILSPQKYLEMYKRSIEDPSGFWSDIASEFYWKKKWDEPVCSENLEVSKGNINIVRSLLGQTRSFSSEARASPNITAFNCEILPAPDRILLSDSTCLKKFLVVRLLQPFDDAITLPPPPPESDEIGLLDFNDDYCYMCA